jgi:hypothetical protein
LVRPQTSSLLLFSSFNIGREERRDRDLDNPRYHWKKSLNLMVLLKGLFFQLMIAAVVQVSKLVWKLKTLTLSVGPTPALRELGATL